MMAKYNPPEQSKLMQLFDIACVVVAIGVALWFPLYMGWAGVSKPKLDVDKTWAALQQTPAQATQWEKLGFDPAKAHDLIQSRWDFSIDWLQLTILTVVIVGYFVFLFKASDQEYREVIDEKFNGK
jgi:uncharacterized membrane protein YraQ (UPF0718 family)